MKNFRHHLLKMGYTLCRILILWWFFSLPFYFFYFFWYFYGDGDGNVDWGGDLWWTIIGSCGVGLGFVAWWFGIEQTPTWLGPPIGLVFGLAFDPAWNVADPTWPMPTSICNCHSLGPFRVIQRPDYNWWENYEGAHFLNWSHFRVAGQ